MKLIKEETEGGKVRDPEDLKGYSYVFGVGPGGTEPVRKVCTYEGMIQIPFTFITSEEITPAITKEGKSAPLSKYKMRTAEVILPFRNHVLEGKMTLKIDCADEKRSVEQQVLEYIGTQLLPFEKD